MAVTSGNGEFDKLARDNTSYREPIGPTTDPSRSAPVLLCNYLVLHWRFRPQSGPLPAHTPHPAQVLHSPSAQAPRGRGSAAPRHAVSRGRPGARGALPTLCAPAREPPAGPRRRRPGRGSPAPRERLSRAPRSLMALPPAADPRAHMCRTESITAIGERRTMPPRRESMPAPHALAACWKRCQGATRRLPDSPVEDTAVPSAERCAASGVASQSSTHRLRVRHCASTPRSIPSLPDFAGHVLSVHAGADARPQRDRIGGSPGRARDT